MIGLQIKDYKVIREIGKGGMATVFLVEHISLQNRVAMKVLSQDFVRNAHIRKRFLAEARSMARMSHSGIIKVTDLMEENDTVAFVMEYIEGETLKEYIDRKGKLKDDEIEVIFSQMLEAVGYVHEQNLVHRDIKPSNFMIDKKGKIKLMDFGIAKNTDESSSEYTLTGTGALLGTPMYMSPEQITETKSVTAQSDIYSLGVVLWQMVTGEKPYDTKSLSNFQLQMKIVQEPLLSTNSRWETIIYKCTDKDVSSRFFKCSEISESIKTGSVKADSSDSTVVESNGANTKQDKPDTQSERTIIDNSQPQIRTDKLGIEFIWVEGGAFDMGSPHDEADRMDDELQHKVSVNGYFMAKYPVTQALWEKVMGSNPSSYSENGSDSPVEMVSWNDCHVFIEKINKQLGSNYRLPTEAEWEFAARGGIKSKGYNYSGSDKIDEAAWYAGNRFIEIEKNALFGLSKKMEIQYLGTHPVGKKKPNELGIYDMSGNVWEWCADWYGYYPTSAQTNPQGPSTGSGRVFRGGSWYSRAQFCRSAHRNYDAPHYRSFHLGFRLVSPE